MHGPKAMAAGICSTGEQKALLIGLILAQARAVASTHAGGAPVLLSRRGAAHLDTERRPVSSRTIAALGAQSWS